MRPALRLLANVKSARYLEPLAPTGLTGLLTHPSPRPTLIFLYKSTLEKLKSLPESSVYRQATEALTSRRLQIIESTKPPGYDAWLERVKGTVAAQPDRFQTLRHPDGSHVAEQQDDELEWDGQGMEPAMQGPRTLEEEARWRTVIEQAILIGEQDSHFHEPMKWEREPALEAEQIAGVEKEIGAGLIEEVIQVAEGELKLVDEMAKSQVWDELVEKPRPGQWSYFERPTSSP